jgi:hypothetical protein
MQNQSRIQTSVQCPSCGQTFNAEVHTMVDVLKDPEAKALLLTGRLNSTHCSNCGAPNTITAPLLYHDPTKELLIAYVPMELDLPKSEQEKIIGDMLNRMPKDDFKGYMFNPRRALTMQGLVDQVLEADGVTPEMMAEQRERVRLAQELVDAPEDQLAALIEQHDARIDTQLFQTLTLMAQRMMEGGQSELAQHILMTQGRIAELSTAGQELIRQQEEQQRIIEEVAGTIEALGPGATRQDFLNLALQYAEDEHALQALVGLARPAFDYEFFQEMSSRIGQAPAAERDALADLRERLLELTSAIDQQSQMAAQNAARFLQALVNNPEPEQMIREHLDMVDDTLLAVLNANIQEAERQKDIQNAARLKEIYNLLINILQENMQPEMRFINELLSAPDEETARELIAQHAEGYGEPLLEMMDAVEELLAAHDNHPLRDRLQLLRAEVEQVLGG